MQDLESQLIELARQVQQGFLAARRTLVTAESCTGGLVSHVLTEIPGSSRYFRGGVVCYANDLKQRLVGVPTDTLEAHGAVSAQTAVAMAEGARALLDADVAVAVTGIAGPDGGSTSKPVGLTYIAVADAAGHEVHRRVWHGDRRENKAASAAAALELILQRLGPGEGR
jgi:PncC family amidohydrolase